MEAPQNYDCKCKVDKTYDPQDEQCRKCYFAKKVLDAMFESALAEGDIETVLHIMGKLKGGNEDDRTQND